jgi:hypothetical protein
MKFSRSIAVFAVTVALAGLAVAIGRARDGRTGPELGAEITVGVTLAESVYRKAPASLDQEDGIVALYLERARLGMGSPFRLIDYSLRDPMLSAARRRQVGHAILGRVLSGDVYSSPTDAMELLSTRPTGRGLAHRAFIERELESAREVRPVEWALRHAYQIATAEGIASPRAGTLAVAAIAQARDRALALRDARDLVLTARRRGIDPLDLVPIWRASRKFQVERPLVDPPTAREERAIGELVPRLVASLDSIATTPPLQASLRRDRALPSALAAISSTAAERRQAPPQAPVVVTLGGFVPYITNSGRTVQARLARASFLSRARTEEALVASFAVLRGADAQVTDASLGMLAVAVAMRAYGQERTWFPGDEGPSPLEVASRLRLGSLDFEKSMPAAWRSYYTRMLDDAVRDLGKVFPKLDVAGLHVKFGDSPLRAEALALHDPRTRTVYFPLATGAGAIAHELTHDLDWQAARRRYGAQSSYRTDRSMRQYRDGLAATVDQLSRGASTRRRVAPGGDRPTEAFARGADWIVANALARKGILNGYLTAVQDEMLIGYASATPPRRDTPLNDATMEALQEIAEVAPSVKAWYREVYGDARTASLAESVRRTLLAPWPRVDLRGPNGLAFDPWSQNGRLLRWGSAQTNAWSCLLQARSVRGSDAGAQVRLMEATAAARARGYVRRWSAWSERSAGAGWRVRSLGGAPWRAEVADSVQREMRDAILWRAARVDDGRPGTDFLERAERLAVTEACAAGRR